MDVDRLAQVLHAHRRALDVPARASLAPGRIPRRLARLLRLPEREVHRVALVGVGVDARAGLQVVKVLPAELAVGGEGLRVVVDVAVVAGVGEALGLQLLDQVDDLGDMLRRLGVDGRPLDAQRVRVRVVFLDEALAQLLDGGALLVGAADHLVIDVGEVLHEGDLIALVLQIAAKRVEDDRRARVADVNIVVDRRSAGVNRDLSRGDRHKLFLAAALCVIDLHVRCPPRYSVFPTGCGFPPPSARRAAPARRCAP